jgi:hypothetical protein
LTILARSKLIGIWWGRTHSIKASHALRIGKRNHIAGKNSQRKLKFCRLFITEETILAKKIIILTQNKVQWVTEAGLFSLVLKLVIEPFLYAMPILEVA